MSDLDAHIKLCERCWNPFDIRAGGVEMDAAYRLTVPDRNGKDQEVWQVGRCYVCQDCVRGEQVPA